VAEAGQNEGANMIAGHFGFAAIVKSREPETPLWILMVATVWLDLVFVPLFVAGIEFIKPVESLHQGYGANLIYADYTHSLIGMSVLSALLGAIGANVWGRRSGVVIGLVAASHWVLDLIVHRADMPIFPANFGNLPRLGFGMWQYPIVSVAIELALVLVGAWLYWGAAKRAVGTQEKGRYASIIASVLIAVFGLLTLWMDFTAD
jgi:membrane-bound metal-dependent hydrolase YbcI (DUF457 family)